MSCFGNGNNHLLTKKTMSLLLVQVRANLLGNSHQSDWVAHRPTFYCTAIRTGNQEDWNAVYARFKEDSGNSHLPFDAVANLKSFLKFYEKLDDDFQLVGMLSGIISDT